MTSLAQHLVDAASLGSLYALAALGIGLIFGVLRLINFAHGDLITIGAYALIVPSASAVAVTFIGSWAAPAMVAAVVAIVVAFALASERVVFRPLRRATAASLLVGSFALSFLLQHIVLLIYGSRPKAVDIGGGLNQDLAVLGLRLPRLELATVVVTVLLVVGLALFLKRTRFGIQMRAAAEDFRMARLLGVRADTVIALAFGLSGVLAAAISLLLITKSGLLSYQMGAQMVLLAFVATVIGGMGSLVGAALGGFLIGVASVAMQVLLPESLRAGRDAFVFLLVILVLLVRPQGLIQVRSLRERV